jgi:two-component system, OmpR family, phosphate regulon sensor histidine kinase PhoR
MDVVGVSNTSCVAILTHAEETVRMETVGFGARNPGETLAASTAAVGFNNRSRAASSNNDLCAALLAIAGHDLRQPLQVIVAAHDMLAKTLEGRDEQFQLARAENATSKLSDKLDQLVDALRLFDPSSSARQEIVQLRAVFAFFAEEFAEAALLKGIRLRVMPTRAVVTSNPVLLRGILRNLIRNAIDYTPSGRSVLVAARRRGAVVHLEVRDNGIGIAASDLVDIFKPFRRVDQTRADGLGLGLFIVNCAAGFLGHRVEVHSTLGRGSRFIVVAKNAWVGDVGSAQSARVWSGV